MSNRQHAYQSFLELLPCNIVTRWVNFRENHLHEHELQLSDCIIRSILTKILCISGIIYNFFNLTLKNSSAKVVNIYKDSGPVPYFRGD